MHVCVCVSPLLRVCACEQMQLAAEMNARECAERLTIAERVARQASEAALRDADIRERGACACARARVRAYLCVSVCVLRMRPIP